MTCNKTRMILLITPSARGLECAATLKEATGIETHWAENLQQAVGRLREQAYSAVVIDQFVLENEPAESDQVLQHLDTAFPVYVNFGVSGMERLVREVRCALHRRKREEAQARRSVEQQLRSEVCDSLTSMLLSCELAMSVPGIPAPAAQKILAVDNLAREMRMRLGVT
jgi:DNA-binding NtrC family response regulator